VSSLYIFIPLFQLLIIIIMHNHLQNQNKESNNNQFCLNCETKLYLTDLYCPNCGQNKHHYHLKIKDLFINFWYTTFNIDGRFLNTIKHIWKPWYLTSQYVAGKRASYFHPVRLFLVLLVLFFTFFLNSIDINNNKYLNNDEAKAILERFKVREEIDQVASNFSDQSVCVFQDSIHELLFKDTDMINASDYWSGESKISSMAFINFGDYTKYKITHKDAFLLPTDSLLIKYNITDFYDRLLIKQNLKFIFNRAEFIKYYVKNFTWALIFIIIGLAGFMKLIYLRNHVYYIEHFILLVQIFSFLLLFVNINSLLSVYFPEFAENIYVYLPLFSLLLFYISFLKYYKQGYIKTFVKTNLFFLAFAFIFLIFGSIFIFISFFLF